MIKQKQQTKQVSKKEINELLELLHHAANPSPVISAADTLDEIRGKALAQATHYTRLAERIVQLWLD